MATQMRDFQSLDRSAPTATRVFVSRIRGISGRATCWGLGIKAVMAGEETYRLDDRVRIVRAGEFVLVPPGQSFEVGVARGREAVGLCIDVPAAPVLAAVGASAPPDAVFRLNDEAVGAAVARIWRNRRVERGFGAVVSAWLGPHQSKLERVVARRPDTRRELYARVERARQYLRDHRGRRVALQEVGEVAHLSSSHLNRVFRQVFGEPPMRFHQRLRLQDAAVRLDQGGVSPTNLADELGYSDLPTFTRAFRKVHGAPPSAFQSKSANLRGRSEC